MPLLEAKDVTKSYQEARDVLPVLKGVSLALERGEIVALEGPSGSGKTTLLSILGCILSPTSGRVRVDGVEVDGDEARRAQVRRRSIGFVFQQFNLFPALTALENVEFALNVKGVQGARARDEARQALVDVGLAERMHALPRDLSGGQKQRVAIARALAGRAPLILADEPTANLDYHTGIQVLAQFRALIKHGERALLVVTHDPKVRDIADRTLEIRDGRLG